MWHRRSELKYFDVADKRNLIKLHETALTEQTLVKENNYNKQNVKTIKSFDQISSTNQLYGDAHANTYGATQLHIWRKKYP